MTDSALSALPADSSLQVDVRRFPSLPGIFLGLSLTLHLAAIVYFAFDSSMQAATWRSCAIVPTVWTSCAQA